VLTSPILSQGALLRIKFTLKKYTGATFATVNIPNRVILSQPIEVFSHSQYLHKKKEKSTPALLVPGVASSHVDGNDSDASLAWCHLLAGSRPDSVDSRGSDDEEQQQHQQHQAREKVRRMEHDSVHVNLIAAIKVRPSVPPTVVFAPF
jgi:hypothetical protein